MKIDFYVLDNTIASGCDKFASKLVEKVFHLKHRIYIHTQSKEQASSLDNLLWTFNQGSFLPHDIIDGNSTYDSPIAIGFDTKLYYHYDVLLNLSQNVPNFYDQFERIAEFVYGDHSNKSLARNRFRQYQQLGHDINTHHIKI